MPSVMACRIAPLASTLALGAGLLLGADTRPGHADGTTSASQSEATVEESAASSSSSSSSGGSGASAVTYGDDGGSGDTGSVAAGSGEVRAAQELLASLGYDIGGVDGVLGPQTRRAISSFQQDAGLPVTGSVDQTLLIALQTAANMSVRLGRLPDSEGASTVELELMATGTGFVVTPEGGILTNQHVIEGCAELRLGPLGTARLIAADPAYDLALLQVDTEIALPVAVFRTHPFVARGETVVAVGFPLHGTLASRGNVTVGTISALAGYNDDLRELQFSAPIQPGNSGGPLLDRSGHVVGVVSSELVADEAVDVPQNVNFAIKAPIVQAFLGAQAVEVSVAGSTESLDVEAVASLAERYTHLVECWADPRRYVASE